MRKKSMTNKARKSHHVGYSENHERGGILETSQKGDEEADHCVITMM